MDFKLTAVLLFCHSYKKKKRAPLRTPSFSPPPTSSASSKIFADFAPILSGLLCAIPLLKPTRTLPFHFYRIRPSASPTFLEALLPVFALKCCVTPIPQFSRCCTLLCHPTDFSSGIHRLW